MSDEFTGAPAYAKTASTAYDAASVDAVTVSWASLQVGTAAVVGLAEADEDGLADFVGLADGDGQRRQCALDHDQRPPPGRRRRDLRHRRGDPSACE